jgi:ABC-type multidrug transport system fused ATPase/permease subunit
MFPSKKKRSKTPYNSLNGNDEDDEAPLSSSNVFSIDEDSDSDDGPSTLASPTQHSYLPKPSASTFSSGHDGGSSLVTRMANFYTTLTFNWLKPLLDLGYEKDQLDPSDLPPMFASDKADEIGKKFESAWNARLRKQRERYNKLRRKNPDGLPPKFADLERDVKTSTTPLAPVLMKAFGGPFLKAGFLKLIHDLCAFVGPNVLKALIRFLKDPDAPLSRGIGLTVIVTLSQLTMSLCLRQYFYQCYRTGLRLRSSVIIRVYRKALKLASGERNARTTGEITNLMSVDAQRLQDLTPYLHAIWYSFLQIGLSIYFLWQELGASCLGGVAVIIVMMPVTKKVGKYLGGLQKKLMKVKDERLKINNEVLSGVKVIKLQAWEKSFEDKIEELRNQEVQHLKKYMTFQALSGTLWSTVPLLVAVATFTSYVASGQELEVEVALTSLALFEILRFPLFMLPNVINNLVEAR